MRVTGVTLNPPMDKPHLTWQVSCQRCDRGLFQPPETTGRGANPHVHQRPVAPPTSLAPHRSRPFPSTGPTPIHPAVLTRAVALLLSRSPRPSRSMGTRLLTPPLPFFRPRGVYTDRGRRPKRASWWPRRALPVAEARSGAFSDSLLMPGEKG